MIGILGSGFGLYGYLPAVVRSTGEQVGLLSKSFDFFSARPELQFCKNRITWFQDECQFQDQVDTVILSLPPSVQADRVKSYLSNRGVKRMILEKPLCCTPAEAVELLDALRVQGKDVRIGYTFHYTGWGQKLIQASALPKAEGEMVAIKWLFKAYHFKKDLKNWKRYHSAGGGAIRFFGIHLLALAILMGFSKVLRSESKGPSMDDYSRWTATLENSNHSVLNLDLDSNSNVDSFVASHSSASAADGSIEVKLIEPFGSNSRQGGDDKRVVLLSNILSDLFQDNDNEIAYTYYKKVNQLWYDVEKVNHHLIEESNPGN